MGFRELFHGVIKSAEEMLDDTLLFGMNRSHIDLKLEDMITKDECSAASQSYMSPSIV